MLAREPFSVDELLDEQVRTFAGQSADAPAAAGAVRRTPATRGRRPRARIAQVVANLLVERDQVLARRRRGRGSAACAAGLVRSR